MKVLITGNMGYVGPAVCRRLRRTLEGATLVGVDNGYFAHCLTSGDRLPETLIDEQRFADVRSITARELEGVDAVVHLAAISNDPMGQQFEDATSDINRTASIALAQAAAEAGVQAFVFASSCSVYGVAEGGARSEGDPVAPLTAYARSKIETEDALAAMATDMKITALRFATACGMSPRLRLDLVLNDFVAAAMTLGKITVLSDGSPWRPLIDVADMARAIEWGIVRDPAESERCLVVNAGANAANYQVRDLAHAVAEALPGTEVAINTDAPVDSRSYRVNFDLFERLAPEHRAETTLAQSIAGLIDGMRAMSHLPQDFRASDLIRLRVLKEHLASGRLGSDLRWAA